MSFPRRKQELAAILLLGSVAVLGSCAYNLSIYPTTRAGLWRGVPQATLPAYTAWMALAAGGFFAFTSFLLVHVDPDKARIAGRLPYGPFHG
jgi:hypothetical protein